MKTKAAAAASNKVAVDEDEDEPKKIRSSRSKRRHTRSSSTESESPPRKRSKKSSKRIADKKSKRSKVSSSSSSRRRRRSPSPSPSLSSSSPSSLSRSYSRRSCSTCSSASERSVSPPPRSRSRDVKKRKVRGRDRERDQKRRKARRSTSCSSSSDSSRSRSKSRKRGTKDVSTKDRTEKDYDNGHASRSEKNLSADVCRDENALVIAKEGDTEIEGYEKSVRFDRIENPPSKDAGETPDVVPADGGSPVPVAEDLELILRQKALENFRKFRAAAKARKTDNGATGKETLTGSLQNGGTKAAEARSAAVASFQRQSSSLGVRHPTGSPRSEDCGNGTSRSWKQESSASMSRRVRSPGTLEDGDSGGPTQQEGSTIEAAHSTFQPMSPQDGRNTRSVMQRLVTTPGSSSSVNQRIGSSAGVSHVNGAPRIRSVVSIPGREGPDNSSFTTTQRHCGSSAAGEINSEIEHNPTDINRTDIGHTNGDDRKTSEASASNGSILSPAEGKSQATEARVEDKDGSQFQKKSFSRMHDGETVEVSYKVYIPKKTPALARRKSQR